MVSRPSTFVKTHTIFVYLRSVNYTLTEISAYVHTEIPTQRYQQLYMYWSNAGNTLHVVNRWMDKWGHIHTLEHHLASKEMNSNTQTEHGCIPQKLCWVGKARQQKSTHTLHGFLYRKLQKRETFVQLYSDRKQTNGCGGRQGGEGWEEGDKWAEVTSGVVAMLIILIWWRFHR